MTHYIYHRKPNELLLDLDTPDQGTWFWYLGLTTAIVKPSQSGKHYHAILPCTPCSDMAAVFLEVSCGSSIDRAMHIAARIGQNISNPSLIISPWPAFGHRKADLICNCRWPNTPRKECATVKRNQGYYRRKKVFNQACWNIGEWISTVALFYDVKPFYHNVVHAHRLALSL